MRHLHNILSSVCAIRPARAGWWIMFLMLVPALAATPQTQEHKGAAGMAEQALQRGDYQAASRQYEQLLEANSALLSSGKAGSGWASVEYNLGNCYYRLGEPLKALLHYERALLLSPSDGHIRENITFVSAQSLQLDETQAASFFFVRWWKSLSQAFDLPQWLAACGVSFVLLLICLLFYFFAPRLGWRKSGFFLALPMLAVCLCSGYFANAQYRSLTVRDTALVMQAEGIPTFSAPSASSATTGNLQAGRKVTILDNGLKDWLQVESAGGNVSWIRREDVEII